MTADWTTCRVVRDCDGDLWARADGGGWVLLWGHFGDEWPTDWLDKRFGPLTPVLDADGLLVVTTVGDLTARHIGRRVRLDEHYDGTLVDIFAHEGRVALNFTHPGGFPLGCARPLDTPCEVLP